jgi:hypothetical protein
MAVLSCVTILRNVARVQDSVGAADGSSSPVAGGSLRGMGYNTMKKLGATFKDKILKHLAPAMRPNSVVYTIHYHQCIPSLCSL